MSEKYDIQELHERMLRVYLKHREENEGFTFYLRTKNDKKGRLRDGYYFRGNDNYIDTSPYKLANKRRISSISFKVDFQAKEGPILLAIEKREHLEKKREHLGDFLEEIANNKKGMPQKKEDKSFEDGHYWYCVLSEDLNMLEKELRRFLNEIVPEINHIAEKKGINPENLFYSGEEFEKMYEKAKKVRSGGEKAKNKTMPRSDTELPLNIILYGPPGTGKTYSVVEKALQIIDGKADKDREKQLQRFNELREQERVEMVTFHQNYAYEDFIEGIKPKLEDNAKGSLSYVLEDGIFKKIANLANRKRKNSVQKIDVKKLVDEYAYFVEQEREGGKEIFLYGAEPRTKTTISEIKRNNDIIIFILGGSVKKVTLHYEVIVKNYEKFETGFILKSKEILNTKGNTAGHHPYYWQLFERMKEFKEKKEMKYVLIIDEINRGNIAKIFGELITLIEESKREGKIEALKVRLPYSKEPFSVPDNLYIIGTMNTADRSIALLDTALRRRFDFEEMMPNHESKLVPKDVEGVNCQKLLEEINRRIRMLRDREHQIGHTYFMNIKDMKGLKRVFQNKIGPLLQEYFFDDWEKINKVLNGNGFINDKDKKLYEWLPFDDEKWNDPEEYKKIYKDSNEGNQDQNAGD